MLNALLQLCLSIVILIVTVYFKLGNLEFDNEFLEIAFIVLLVNGICIWLTHKHKPKYYQQKAGYILAPFVKSFWVQLFLALVLGELLLANIIYKEILIVAILVYSFCELLIFYVYVKFGVTQKLGNSESHRSEEVKKYEQTELAEQKNIEGKISANLIPDACSLPVEIVNELLHVDANSPINNNGLSESDLLLLKDRNVRKQSGKSTQYSIAIIDFVLNDIKRINKFIIDTYDKICPGGLLILSYKEIEVFEQEYFSGKNAFVKLCLTIYYYSFKRAMPKIWPFNKLYFLLTNGKNRVISKAEVWGRLAYCGFDVLQETQVDGINYLIAKKNKTISENPSPSYSPVITLNRVSLNGKIIKIHKVRSMYPYSEFIQKKVFDQNSISSTGKFNDDFRITRLGKLYRKYWIDELPQIIDWMRGEIKIVGIRAMSQHFFSLYPQVYKDFYFQVKPGIISPIFDENTADFSEIVKIEQEYLESYLRDPVKTDIRYFFITLKHIFSGVRSK